MCSPWHFAWHRIGGVVLCPFCGEGEVFGWLPLRPGSMDHTPHCKLRKGSSTGRAESCSSVVVKHRGHLRCDIGR